MTDSTLSHLLNRSLVIRAPRATVFAYFTDSARWAAWWGTGSTIDASPGGRVFIRLPNGIEMIGEVVSIDPGSRIEFTYGYASGRPIPPGGSTVTIVCDDDAKGTRLTLAHRFADAAICEAHEQGWRYHLSVFANVVADAMYVDAAANVDAWHAMWADPDAASRQSLLATLATQDIRFADRFSAVSGAAELLPHIAATQQFMPGLRLERDGDIRHCQGTVLADWIARAADGQERARGTNVYTLDAYGRIEAVVGMWRG